MKRYLFLILFISISLICSAQRHVNIKAIVLDSLSQQPIGYVTVAVLKVKDSALVSYMITDKSGTFSLRNLSVNEPLRLLVSCVGYKSAHIALSLKGGSAEIDLGQIMLVSKILNEVIIKAERNPVTIKKDTIEFDAEAFKVRPNAVVEDLLRKLPGVQVNISGGITVNGKTVSKVKIDGKEFFTNDPTIATRNLDADMISKVQVYDDRDDDPDHLVPEYKVNKIINLKFKKAFKQSIIGNGDLGAGTNNRYEADGFFSKFHDDFQLSAKVGSDNLSGTKLFIGDMHLPAGFGGSGITDMNVANVNFNEQITRTFKLNAEYELNDRLISKQQSAQTQQFIGDTTFTTNSSTKNRQHEHDQGLYIKAEWKPDSVTTIKYNPDLNYSYNAENSNAVSNSYTNFVDPLNRNVASGQSTYHSFQYQHMLNYYRKLKSNGASISVTNGLNIHPDKTLNDSFNDLISYSAALPSDTISRSGENTNTDYSGSLGVGYHYPFSKKLSLDVSVAGNYDRNEGDLLTYEEDFKTGLYTIYNAEQSSDLVRNQWQQTVHPDLTYNFNDNVSLKLGFAAQLLQINNHFSSTISDLDEHFFYLIPVAELHIKNMTLSYSEDVKQPGINDLRPITIVYSPLFTFIGNPNLKPTRLHNAGLNFNHYYQESQLYMNFNSQMNIETNTILRERTVNAEGATITTPTNRNGRFTARIDGSYGKSFKKQGDWVFSVNGGANFITGHNFFEVNGQDGYQNTAAIDVTQQFSANWNDIIDLRPGYGINYAITKYQFVSYAPQSYTTQRATMVTDLFLPKKFVWSVDYTYEFNPLVAPGFQRNANIMSIAIAKHMQKNDKGELRLMCYDLFNQGVSSFHYASENTINDNQSIMQRRYFLISYSYRFTKVTNK
ncbi:MAG: outer membrane beta-barrel protein [Bacteroidetes bacterium]|nr:outer membrane beta-barrel protein [Bacteroidota bacterium]